MSETETPELFLREIQLGDKTKPLSLGDEAFNALKMFLRQDAWRFHEENIVKTYVYVDSVDQGARIWGFVSLMCSSIELEESQRLEEPAGASAYDVFPAIKIARLAVDKRLRGKGYGKSLMDYTIAFVTDKIMPHVGCRFLIVDSKKESISFYEKCGFILVDSDEDEDDETKMMFIDLHLLKGGCG